MPLMNRALSIRGNKPANNNRNKGFSFNRFGGGSSGNSQKDNTRRLYQLIKSENNLVQAYETAARERSIIAKQLSEWGEQTGDDAVSDLSDKIGVILSEMADQEDNYANHLESVRGRLKVIRNTERSVAPARENKVKIMDEIHKLKMKDPENQRLPVLEQELVRSEAENLVADAQLTNITRQKMKEAYNDEFAAIIERAEKQLILAKHGRRLLSLLDDSPTVPGVGRPAYEHSLQARQVLNDAEDDLREWAPESYDDYSGAGSDRIDEEDEEEFDQEDGMALSSEPAPGSSADAMPRSAKKNKKNKSAKITETTLHSVEQTI
ncbi:hypothetical protein TD95_000571 [Thielaviopsis punctulata]|uniref:Sphingolipid long chain base-responsive protein LSP1 n=1 Tax=Thielaviopsis punctulata TaxID=72032 RepID=A0A0F4ZLR4_9PEZI|nr:hypothetical protein TD95_000571 [Thielaviopsis punctulata]